MSDVHETPETPKKHRAKYLRNPLLICLRHSSGRRRHVRGTKVDVLERRIAVSFTEGPGTLFTEWFDKKHWSIISSVEKAEYFERVERERQAKIERRLAKAEGKWERQRVRQHEKYLALKAKSVAAKAAQAPQEPPQEPPKNRITFAEVPERVVLPEPPVPTQTASADVLTPSEEATLSSPAKKVENPGNLNIELPGEYNARLHVEKDKPLIGSIEDAIRFKANVEATVTTQEAMRKIKMMQARGRLKKGLESEAAATGAGAAWGTE